ncbi:TetR/AcrR family transcriptional regulator [Nakamurella lactea]|uniref:TetR/AcrR family transcriptional regulator n=1 Tax=Nakamurella lactea TaxID=459515 RepID=UPI00048BD5AF|nr:TetR/AcrR family transcriptional regulator [Nakamurella lactea]
MATDTRDRILTALRGLLASGGTDAATLENVAAAAGVSKGGLLYHFPSKQELFHGLLEQTKQAVAAELSGLTSRDDVVRTFLEYSAPRDEQERGFITALITGIRNEGGQVGSAAGQESGPGSGTGTGTGADDEYRVAGLFADIFAAWEEPIRQSVDDPVTAEIILQVGNGMYLAAVCGLPAPDPELTRQLVDRLVAAAS